MVPKAAAVLNSGLPVELSQALSLASLDCGGSSLASDRISGGKKVEASMVMPSLYFWTSCQSPRHM
jgi:hypothetical protein